MKNILLIFLASLLLIGCESVQGQNKEIELFVKQVIDTYNKKDTKKFNQLIDKNTGLIFVTTLGATNKWSKVQKICLTDDCLRNEKAVSVGIPYQSFLEKDKFDVVEKIEFTDSSYFECEKIDKYGVFVSSENKYHILSETVIFFLANYWDIIGEELDSKKKNELTKELEQFQHLESKSHRITVNSKSGTFIFYITLIRGKWFLTIIDFASMDCSV